MKKFDLTISKVKIPADLDTAVGLYLKLRDLYPQSALLESSDYHGKNNSTSFIGIDPIASFSLNNDKLTCRYPDGTYEDESLGNNDVIERMGSFISSFILSDSSAAENGFFGYFAYDAVCRFEKVEIRDEEEFAKDIPQICYILYRYLLCIDHYRNEMTITEFRPENECEGGINEIISYVRNDNKAIYPLKLKGEPHTPVKDEDYIKMVEKGIAHTLRGDVFQIVLSRRFEQSFEGDDFCVYRALRCVNPSPYLFYFDFGSFRIFGSSPETHLRVRGKEAWIDPIAGTFKRTGDPEGDARLAAELLKDEKENAEHIMLVDLARNDLSRSGGKVEVEFLRSIVYYSHVIHMVSRVKAILPEGTDTLRLLADTFPAGTLSGAPKVRAMQLINEIEPHSRVTYGGCVGMIGFNGDLNQAITIRSFLSTGNVLYSQAGAGVVAKSDPESELKETVNKLGALAVAVKYAEQFGRR